MQEHRKLKYGVFQSGGCMAKNKRGGSSRRKGYRYLIVDESLSVGNLTTKDVIADDFDVSVDEDTFMISAKLVWGTSGFTVGEGPLIVGLAHNDYTAAEIEEHLEEVASWDEGDQIAGERRRRKIRTVGTFPLAAQDEVLNDGRPLKTKLGFWIQDGHTLKTWAYNPTTGTIATGGIVHANGGINARRK